MKIEVKRVDEALIKYHGSIRASREAQQIQLDIVIPIETLDEQLYREVYAKIHDFSIVDGQYYKVYLGLTLTLENDCHYELIDGHPTIISKDERTIIGTIRRNLEKDGSIRQYIVEMVGKLVNGIDTCDGIGMIEKKTNDIVPTTSREEMEKFWEGK